MKRKHETWEVANKRKQ